MKITRVKPILCDGGWRPFVFVKVETNEGITGYGECTEARTGRAIAGCIEDLEEVVKDKDPRAVEKLYFDMSRAMQSSIGGIAQRAIAGIEVALWDVKAKALNVPLYELFGGPIRDRIRIYWSHCGSYRARPTHQKFMGTPPIKTYADITRLGEEVLKRGYTALKTNMLVPGDPSYTIVPYDQNFDHDILKLVDKQLSTFRKAVGDDVDIMLDTNFHFKTEGYIQIAKVVEPYKLQWLELDIYDPDALLQIKEATKVPICSTECLTTMKGFEPYLRKHAVDICMIDLPWNGYIESRRVAALANMYETMVAPHNYYSHLSTFMNAHLCAVIPNLKILETDFDSVKWRDELVTEVPDIRKGYLYLPKKPGIGVELNEKAIAKHPWPGK